MLNPIIESDRDLCGLFNSPGFPKKFEEVGANDTPQISGEVNQKLLQRMTIVQLREHAEAEEIDLGDAKSKVEIIESIILA